MIQKITSLDTKELEIYARLNEAQLFHYNEPARGIFIAESPKVITRALDAGCTPLSFLAEEKMLEGEARGVLERLLATVPDLPIYTAENSLLTSITGYQLTRGALCAFLRPELPDVATLCANSRRIVVLEDVVNPTNIGAIFRSAAALGMDAVLLTPASSDPFYRRAARVSMGTVFQIPWTYLPKDTNYTELLHRLGYKTVAMALRDNSVSIDDAALKKEPKLAVVLGTEGEGLCQASIDSSDYVVMIPMAHGVDSLNVAAASAVAFWELSKTI